MSDMALKFALAEIVRLNARIVELETELAARAAGKPAPVTINAIPTPAPRRGHARGPRPETPFAKDYRRKGELRDAVKAANRAVEDAWWRNSMGARREMSLDEKRKTLNDAMVAARAVARAELRKRWVEEDAEQLVELPAHITRIASPAP